MSQLRRCLALALPLAALAQPAPLPVEVRDGWCILTVQATVDRKQGRSVPLRLILDTGATTCVVDRTVPRGIFGSEFRLEKNRGIAGATHAFGRSLKHLSCGTAAREDVPVQVLDLEGLNRHQDLPVDGVLGMSFLEGLAFTVDPAAQTLVWDADLRGKAVFPFLSGDQTLRTGEGDRRPFLAIQVDGDRTFALLDTGAATRLLLPSPPLGRALSPECELATGVTGQGLMATTRADVEALGRRFPDTRAKVVRTLQHSVLGSSFLFSGPVCFDFRRRVVGVAAGPGTPAGPPRSRAPVGWVRRGPEPYLDFDPIEPCDPWYKAGFRHRDRVQSVEGLQGRLSLQAIQALLKERPERAWRVLRDGQILDLRSPEPIPTP